MLVYQWFLSGFAGFTSLKTVHGFGPPLPSGQGRTVRIVTFHLLAPAGVSVRVTGCSTWQRTSPGVYTGTAVATHTRTRGHRGTGIWATYSRVHLATGPLLLDHWLLALGPLAAGTGSTGCWVSGCWVSGIPVSGNFQWDGQKYELYLHFRRPLYVCTGSAVSKGQVRSYLKKCQKGSRIRQIYRHF